MNMFKASKASNIKDYIKSIPEERKTDFNRLYMLIKKQSGFKPYFANNMIGFGKFEYVNSKKETINWPIIALANQKNYISIYVCSLKDGKYIAEVYEKSLGKVSVGKSCIRIKKLEDVDLETLKKVIKEAVKNPGLV